MSVKITNNASGTLAAGITDTATTLTLSAGQGALFPTLASGDYCWCTLVDTSNNVEIIKVTARSTDTLTMTRGQDNTTARAFAINDRLELRPTAALFEEFVDKEALPILKSANYTAVVGETILVTAGSITITLPATPAIGNTVIMKDGTGAAATTSWTVGRNGSNIASSATDLTFDKDWDEICMTYINSTIGWSI